MIDVFDLGCGACVVRRLDGSRAVYESGCGNVTPDAKFGEKVVNSNIILLLTTGGGGEMRSC